MTVDVRRCSVASMTKRGGKNKSPTLYDGPLATPIFVTGTTALQKIIPDEELLKATNKEQDALVLQAWREKLLLLLRIYGIDVTAAEATVNSPMAKPWVDLALSLAVAHVPGFTVKQRRGGAPIRNSPAELIRFAKYVGNFRRKTAARQAISDSSIAQRLAKSKDFKTTFPQFANTSAKRLQNLISQTRRSLKTPSQ